MLKNLERPLRRLLCAIPFATMLAAMAGPGAAFAQSCTGLCPAQTADQEALLAPFNTLLTVPGGPALLAANLQTENYIYLNSTQAQKIASGTILIVDAIPANVLIRAFPGNPSFYYDAQGLPTAPALPSSVSTAVLDLNNYTQVDSMKSYFGGVNIYGNAYGMLPGQTDPLGNPPPYQVSSAILNNPFTAANSSALAAANQQTPGLYGVNWQLGDSNIGDFPSAHTLASSINAIAYAILAPGYYQQLAGAAANFAYDLNVNGVHYPTDVIGGRVLATYVIAETLAGNNPTYPSGSTTFTQANLASLSQAMQAYLGGGSSSPYAAACGGNVAACVAGGVIPSAAAYTQALQSYNYFLTYGLPSIGDTTQAPVVPADAYWLIATRFPYLNETQLNQILYTTELPSGGLLDTTNSYAGWERLNLYAAAGGYGAFPSNVTVNMNATLGGLNAFDIWINNISGTGGLTLQGSGTLILAGNDSYTGGTNVQGGTLAVTGTLGGDLSISPGATFVSNGGYAVAGKSTLANAGTFIEVNTPLINAGTASNTGIIVGDVNNFGTFNNNNAVVTGAFTNTASGLLSGNGVLGSLAGAGTVTLGPTTLTTGGNNTSTTFSGAISGNGSLTKTGTGTFTLSGANLYTGPTSVDSGTLDVTGSLVSSVTVNSGGTLMGTGTIGGLSMNGGGIVRPDIGTMTVGGNVAFGAGSTYQVEVNPTQSDKIAASGTATLSGGTVQAVVDPGAYAPLTKYTILTANGGVGGSFANVTAGNLAFLTPSLSYDPNDVFLSLTRVAFTSAAVTPNQFATANAIGAGAVGSGLAVALVTQSAAGARQAFDALSGEIHASAQTAMLDDSLYLREAVLGRMRQASFTGGIGPMESLASGGPTLGYADESGSSPPRSSADPTPTDPGGGLPAFSVKAASAAAPATTFWTQALGARGGFSGNGNAADMSRTLAGFFSGVDHRFGPNWLAGFAGGYTGSSVSVNDRASSANTDTAHLAGYAGAAYGPWNLRSAAAASFGTLSTSRLIVFPGFVDSTTARYNAITAQIFGEVSYGVALGPIAAEPFGGLAFVHLSSGSFVETAGAGSGIAALSGSGSSDNVGYSTLGGRAAASYVLPNGMVLMPRVSAAWEHALGSLTPTAALTFQSTGAPFTVAGLPLARDSAIVESGLVLHLNPQTKFGLSYSSQLGNHVQDNSVQGNLTWLF